MDEKFESTKNNTLDKTYIDSSTGCDYSITLRLRYVKKQIYIDQGVKYELRLQQMWQGSDGSEDWRWVEVVE